MVSPFFFDRQLPLINAGDIENGRPGLCLMPIGVGMNFIKARCSDTDKKMKWALINLVLRCAQLLGATESLLHGGYMLTRRTALDDPHSTDELHNDYLYLIIVLPFLYKIHLPAPRKDQGANIQRYLRSGNRPESREIAKQLLADAQQLALAMSFDMVCRIMPPFEFETAREKELGLPPARILEPMERRKKIPRTVLLMPLPDRRVAA